MFYIGFGLCLILAGFSLLVADGTSLAPGSKIPFDFGEYKNHAGVVFSFLGVWLIWLGRNSLRSQSTDETR